ncbi:MAG TPA: sensor histidine kinase N-terminal domain-containing protein, partial [Opitutaceae bacterium]|nr:sensor histidine kinase N-terminal domain-containing protein [Opitutaceae bacterium]
MTSLRRQLTRVLLATFALLLGAGLASVYFFVWDELVDAFDATLRAKAAAVGAAYRDEKGVVSLELPAELARTFGGDKPRNFFEIWDAAGQPVARSRSLRGEDLPRGLKGKDKSEYWNLRLPGGRHGRAFAHLPAREKGAPEITLVVAADREALDETLGGIGAAVAGCAFVLLAAVWLAVPWVLRRGLAPLDRLGEEVARIHVDSLDKPLSVANLPAELRPIGDRLNALLARLAESFERERRFSADVAH